MSVARRTAVTVVLDGDGRLHNAVSAEHRRWGWETARVTSLESALRVITRRPEIDVVVVDVTSDDAAEFLAEKARHPIVARLRVFLVDAEMKLDLQGTTRDLVTRITDHRERRPT
jgi:hypothetical protein